MRNLYSALLVAAIVSVVTVPALAQAPATDANIKALQPGLFEVSSPRISDAIAAGIIKISATPGKGHRSINVESPWGNSFFGYPKNMKQVGFTIDVGKPAGGATINAPGFTEAAKEDYRATIQAIVKKAVAITNDNHVWMEGSSN